MSEAVVELVGLWTIERVWRAVTAIEQFAQAIRTLKGTPDDRA